MGGDGPRATPTIHDGRLYSLGATGILNCLDPATGSVIWMHNILYDAGVDPASGNLTWAMAGSPLVFDDLVVVNAGGSNEKAVIAYDRVDGTQRWAGGSRRAGYSSPMLATLSGVRQILIFGGDGLSGHDVADGRELWFQEWTTNQGIHAIQPIVLEDESIFISSGYNVGCGLFRVTQTNGTWKVEETGWGKRENKFKLKFNDGIYKDGYIYGLDEGILACFDVKSGEIVWKKGRYKFGQIIMVDDLLLIISESGRVVLVEANPKEFREIAGFQAIAGKTWNHPALAHGRLLVRNAEEAACFDVR
jgi:outer membrane protein assembly factor BamB